MNEAQKARVQELVEELDSLVPCTEAHVVMNVYGGGCDEGQITATENGYLRLGIALLQAPFLPPVTEGKAGQLDLTLEGLVSEQSDINFHLFLLDDTLTPDAVPAAPHIKQPWSDKLVGTGCVLSCLLLVYIMAVGFVTIVHWILR